MVRKKLNNKGYMLVEIILASALAFAMAFFLLELTIKLKNKNNDLLAKALTATDKAIIANKVMTYLIDKNDTLNCFNINMDIGKTEDYNTIKINGYLNLKVNKYAELGGTTISPISYCKDYTDSDTGLRRISIIIPLWIKNNENNEENYVKLNYLIRN